MLSIIIFKNVEKFSCVANFSKYKDNKAKSPQNEKQNQENTKQARAKKCQNSLIKVNSKVPS